MLSREVRTGDWVVWEPTYQISRVAEGEVRIQYAWSSGYRVATRLEILLNGPK